MCSNSGGSKTLVFYTVILCKQEPVFMRVSGRWFERVFDTVWNRSVLRSGLRYGKRMVTAENSLFRELLVLWNPSLHDRRQKGGAFTMQEGKSEDVKQPTSGRLTRKGTASGCLLFFFPPLGIPLTWLITQWRTKTKIVVTVISLIWLSILIFAPLREPKPTGESQSVGESERARKESVVSVVSVVSADPLDHLRVALEDELGRSNRDLPRITEFMKAGNNLHITFTINENLTEGLIKTSAKIDVTKILKTVDSWEYDFDELVIFGSMSLVDKFGNAEEENVLKVTYRSGTVDRINWDNFLHNNVYAIADNFWLHPVMR